MINVFVYGTLLNKQLLIDIVGRYPQNYTNTLLGYKKVGLNIIESEHDKVYGITFEVTKKELKALDVYESVATGLYKRIEITLESGEEAIAYQLTTT